MAEKEKEVKEVKILTVYNMEGSAQIIETDLKLWEKAGYSLSQPETVLSRAEQEYLKKRLNK